jgi:hypothetical protein
MAGETAEGITLTTAMTGSLDLVHSDSHRLGKLSYPTFPRCPTRLTVWKASQPPSETFSNGSSAGMAPVAGPTGRCALTEHPTPSGDHRTQFSCQQPARPVAAAALIIEPTARPATSGQGIRPPAPNYEFYVVLSLCLPKQPAFRGTWKPPAM